jgi:hypothetical protein
MMMMMMKIMIITVEQLVEMNEWQEYRSTQRQPAPVPLGQP